jgi:predicted aconitase
VESVVIGEKELKESWAKLHTANRNEVDLVAIGCPHCTLLEIKKIASLLEDRTLANHVRLLIGASIPIVTLARREGYGDTIEKAGGVFTEACVGPMNPAVFLGDTPRTVATNSARAAHYIFRTSGGEARVLYGDLERCIDSAVIGKWEG